MRKIFSLMLSGMLVLGLLAACGTTASPTTAPTTGTGANPAAPTAAMPGSTPAAGKVILPEIDTTTITGDIISAGSSTVYPLSEAMAERFTEEGYTGNITIDSVGTGAGFERFCVAAETDIANASRAIKAEEAAACTAKKRDPLEFRVGTDALVVAVSKQNTFLKNLTTDQLKAIYSGKTKNWQAVDPAYPDQPIKLFSPGTDSGTFDYFVEAIFAKKKEELLGANPQLSEDDNVLVQGVAGDQYAIGYFGYAYYEENASKLTAVSIEGIEPNEATAENGTYPLSRPLFIYSSAEILKAKPHVAAFINFYLTYVNEEIIAAGYFPASAEALDEAKQRLLDATK